MLSYIYFVFGVSASLYVFDVPSKGSGSIEPGSPLPVRLERGRREEGVGEGHQISPSAGEREGWVYGGRAGAHTAQEVPLQCTQSHVGSTLRCG